MILILECIVVCFILLVPCVAAIVKLIDVSFLKINHVKMSGRESGLLWINTQLNITEIGNFRQL